VLIQGRDQRRQHGRWLVGNTSRLRWSRRRVYFEDARKPARACLLVSDAAPGSTPRARERIGSSTTRREPRSTGSTSDRDEPRAAARSGRGRRQAKRRHVRVLLPCYFLSLASLPCLRSRTRPKRFAEAVDDVNRSEPEDQYQDTILGRDLSKMVLCRRASWLAVLPRVPISWRCGDGPSNQKVDRVGARADVAGGDRTLLTMPVLWSAAQIQHADRVG